MVSNKQLYCIHSNYVNSQQKHGLLSALTVDTPDFSVRKPFVCPKLPNWECMNREDLSVACCTLQRNPIAESHSDKRVGSAFDNEEPGEGRLLSVRDNIHVGKGIQLIAGFELVVVCIEWNVQAVNVDRSMMEPNNEVGKIMPVRRLNVEHEGEHFLRQDQNVNMFELVVVCELNRCFVVYMMVQMVVTEHKNDVGF